MWYCCVCVFPFERVIPSHANQKVAWQGGQPWALVLCPFQPCSVVFNPPLAPQPVSRSYCHMGAGLLSQFITWSSAMCLAELLRTFDIFSQQPLSSNIKLIGRGGVMCLWMRVWGSCDCFRFTFNMGVLWNPSKTTRLHNVNFQSMSLLSIALKVATVCCWPRHISDPQRMSNDCMFRSRERWWFPPSRPCKIVLSDFYDVSNSTLPPNLLFFVFLAHHFKTTTPCLFFGMDGTVWGKNDANQWRWPAWLILLFWPSSLAKDNVPMWKAILPP